MFFPHTPTSVHPSVAYHRVLTRFGEGFGSVATRLLQRASWRGTEGSPIGQLSGVFRAAARLILLLSRSGSVTDRIRTELHWLDIPSRVAFKLCVLAYRCIHGSAPSYLDRPFLHTGQCNRWTFATVTFVLRRRVCYLCRGHTL